MANCHIQRETLFGNENSMVKLKTKLNNLRITVQKQNQNLTFTQQMISNISFKFFFSQMNIWSSKSNIKQGHTKLQFNTTVWCRENT